VRGEEERDSAFGFQGSEWVEQRRFSKIIRRVLQRWWQLLWRRLRLQLGCASNMHWWFQGREEKASGLKA